MKKYLSSVVAAALLSTMVVGCSDNDDDNGDTPVSNTYKAEFAATPNGETSGVSYDCGDGLKKILEGTEGLYGPCANDSIVKFSLGNVELGQIKSETVIANNNVVKTTDLVADASLRAASPLAIKNTALLYSVDADANPDNGVGVKEEAIEALNEQFPEGSTLDAVDTTVLEESLAVVTAGVDGLQQVTVEEAAVEADKVEEAIITPPAEAGPVPPITGAN
jgi:hypothetical protein